MHHHPDLLEEWYRMHSRPLPWRVTKDPYRIWVSEIILQQTRVIQGIPYYHAFLDKFPEITALAEASEDDVLRAWQGLGYYRRALNMHRAARYIVQNHNGIFPDSPEELRKLPGVGDYTASAIASICFNFPSPAIDGNVRRFLSRLYLLYLNPSSAKDTAILKTLASQFLSGRDSGTMNQALIEFGAMQCVPVNPDCSLCPFDDCMALKEGVVHLLPVKTLKKELKIRHFLYLVYTWTEGGTEHLLMHRRGKEDIWAGMYDFPLAGLQEESAGMVREPEEVNHWCNISGIDFTTELSDLFTHQLTHQQIRARFRRIRLKAPPFGFHPDAVRVPAEKLRHLAKPRLISRYLEAAGFDL